MTTNNLAILGIFVGLAFFVCLWSLCYLVIVGVLIQAWLSGKADYKRTIQAVVYMIVLWPVAVGMAVANIRRQENSI